MNERSTIIDCIIMIDIKWKILLQVREINTLRIYKNMCLLKYLLL